MHRGRDVAPCLYRLRGRTAGVTAPAGSLRSAARDDAGALVRDVEPRVLDRQPYREPAAFAGCALHLDRAAELLEHLAHEREAEPGPAVRARARRVDLIEALEDPVLLLGLDPDAVVADREQDVVALHARRELAR